MDLLIPFNSSEQPLTVGTPVARGPPHRPGRAVFPHPVPRLYSFSRRAKSSCKYPMRSLRLGDCRASYSQSIQRFRECFPGKATLLTAPAIEPFECTFLGPPIESVQSFAVAPESVIVVVPLQSPIQFLRLVSDASGAPNIPIQ